MRKYCVFMSIALMSFLSGATPYKVCMFYRDLLIFPHQVAIADIVCTGTVLTNFNGDVADFSVDETLWGIPPTTNILIRCADNLDRLSFEPGDKYLVFAFTNNWWSEMRRGDYDFAGLSSVFLSEFLTPTNRPSNNAVFSDYRIMDSKRSVFNFNQFNINGTNYWPGARTFITNFLEISRIKNDYAMAFGRIKSILNGSQNSNPLPEWLLKSLYHYELLNENDLGPGRYEPPPEDNGE